MQAAAATEMERVLALNHSPPRRKPRWIENLQTVELRETGPFASSRRLRGAKGQGQRYEQKFGKFLQRTAGREAELLSGQWFEFEDANGPGWAQTDHLLIYPGSLIIFECKLTQHPSARLQLEGLYLPLVHAVWPDYSIQLVEVFRNITEGDPGREIQSLANLRRGPLYGAAHLWHWLR